MFFYLYQMNAFVAVRLLMLIKLMLAANLCGVFFNR